MTTDLEIRSYQQGDEASIVEGWNEIFPAQDGIPPRDVAYWDWQFRNNPIGRPEIVVADVAGRIVGQYACVPQRARSEGQSTTIGLIVDAFVLPEYRRARGRPGLVIHLAQRLHELYCGPRAECGGQSDGAGHALLYGYPFPIWRIAQRYLASELVRDMDVLFREVTAPNVEPILPSDKVTIEIVRDAATLREIGDDVWKLCEADVRFGLVRDGAWLHWRYFSHPHHDYEIVLARDTESGAPRGLGVLRQGNYAVRAAICVDWVVPVDDEDAERSLLAWMHEHAKAVGESALLAHFPQQDPRFLRWQRRGFLVGPPSHFLVMNTFGHHVRWLRERWHQTLGDSDLV